MLTRARGCAPGHEAERITFTKKEETTRKKEEAAFKKEQGAAQKLEAKRQGLLKKLKTPGGLTLKETNDLLRLERGL